MIHLVEEPPGGRIQGQYLRLTDRREVAIYLREGCLWIAEFIDGEGHLFEPSGWFRFNCATARHGIARQRMKLEAAIPLTMDIAARIESLHREAGKGGGEDEDKEAS